MPTPTLDQLRDRHPQHREKADHWQLLSDMVAGGDRMTHEQKAKLLANPDGRPKDVMDERIKLSTYTNKIGPVLSRFNSELFAEPASYQGSKDEFWENEFFQRGAILSENNSGRANFHSFLMSAMFQAMTTGKAIAQVDAVISSEGTTNLKAQAERKELNPYVVLHPRINLWDWEVNGESLSFAKLHLKKLTKERWDMPRTPIHDFTIYQQETSGILVSRYLVRPADLEKMPDPDFNLENVQDDDVVIETLLENEQVFRHNGEQKFPIIILDLPNTLWVGSQLFEPQKAYYNQTASLEWGLYTSGYAMPIISGVDDEDEDPVEGSTWGDGYYLTLKPGQSISWTERPGNTFASQSSYRGEIKRDIYDTLQQIAMSAADGVSIIARSGQSKFEDRRPEQILLETFGQFVKNFALPVLEAAAIAHAETGIKWEIEGFSDFLGEGLAELIADYMGVKGADIPSATFKREVNKRFAQMCCSSLEIPSDKWVQIAKELDEAKTEDSTPAPAVPEQPPAPAKPIANNGNGKVTALIS